MHKFFRVSSSIIVKNCRYNQDAAFCIQVMDTLLSMIDFRIR